MTIFRYNLLNKSIMKVYVAIEWFYDGDSYIVSSYLGVKGTYEEAKKLNPWDYELMSDDDFEICDGDRQPKEFGSYYSKAKVEIREEVI